MLIFLFVFVTLYGAMNFYLFRKVNAAWPGHLWFTLVVGAFCVAMVAAPILVRTLEREGADRAARVCALVGHAWVAIIFWFVVLAAAGDLWNLGVRIAAHWRPGASGWVLAPRPALALCGGLILVACIWGFYEASQIRLNEVHFRTAKLIAGTPPLRIAVVADIHLSLTLRDRRLKRILRVVDEARPDILVGLGDLTDLPLADIGDLADRIARVPAPLGKFAILGNHEYYNRLENSLPFLRAAGFRLLRGESVAAGGVIVVGVDDRAGFETQQEYRAGEIETLTAAAADGRPVILLKHRPDVTPASLGKFDLQLSGHTHGGQIFPFYALTRLFFRHGPGMHDLSQGSWLYVTRGAGTWGPPFRLLAPPEVMLVIVEPAV